MVKNFFLKLKIKKALLSRSPQTLLKCFPTQESFNRLFENDGELIGEILHFEIEKKVNDCFLALFEAFNIEQRERFLSLEVVDEYDNKKTVLEDFISDPYYLIYSRVFVKKGWIRPDKKYSVFIEELPLETNVLHLAFEQDNYPIIQSFITCKFHHSPELSKLKPNFQLIPNSWGFLPFAQAIIMGAEECAQILAFHYRNLFSSITKEHKNFLEQQLINCFNYLRDRLSKKKRSFFEDKEQELQTRKICLSLVKVSKILDLSFRDLIKEKNDVILYAIMKGETSFLEVCFNLLIIDFSTIKGNDYPAIAWAAKFYQTSVIKQFNKFQDKWKQQLVFPKHLQEEYIVNFLDIPYFIELNYGNGEKDNLNAKKYLHFFYDMVEYFNINLNEKNIFGNTHLHNLCHAVKEENFKETILIFKHFIKVMDYNVKNQAGKKPLDLIQDPFLHTQFAKLIEIKEELAQIDDAEFTLLKI